MTGDRCNKVKNMDDALAITASDLSNSKTISNNIELRNTMQIKTGPLQHSSNGMSAAQLRKQKVNRRKINDNIATAHMPLVQYNNFNEHQHAMICSSGKMVTPTPAPIGEHTNFRWYNNSLCKTEDTVEAIVPSNISISSKANLKSVISNVTERESAVEILRKKVIKRLIDVTSPTSTKKQKLFQKLNNNQSDIKTIIEMSVEMESSIEDTKRMLFNNCL